MRERESERARERERARESERGRERKIEKHCFYFIYLFITEKHGPWEANHRPKPNLNLTLEFRFRLSLYVSVCVKYRYKKNIHSHVQKNIHTRANIDLGHNTDGVKVRCLQGPRTS